MDFQIKQGNVDKQKTSCVVSFVYEKTQLSPSSKSLDKTSKSHISSLLKKDGFKGDFCSHMMLHNVPNLSAEKVLLVGLGNAKKLSEKKLVTVIKTIAKELDSRKVKDAIFCVEDIEFDKSISWKVRQVIIHALDGLYRYDNFKTNKNAQNLKKMTFFISNKKDVSSCETALKQGMAIGNSMSFTKDLANLPANFCNPEYIGKTAKELAKKSSKLKVTVLNEKQITKLKMGTLLAVAKGSDNPPTFSVLEYNGGKKGDKPIVLVGKGVTFDTGGYSLKPGPYMIGMKYDMCGAATVLGVMKAVAELKLPINVVGLVPSVENMISGGATRPDDIVTSMSGKTVEILNTDAEGRLILCDALTYAKRYKPKAVIDIATLTGAVIVALGREITAVLSNHEPLAEKLVEMGKVAEDRCWELPVWEDYYQSLIESPFADLANLGAGGEAGTITAARFLANFAEEYNWAHLDVAGTASEFSGRKKGAKGRPVNLLVHYLLDCCSSELN